VEAPADEPSAGVAANAAAGKIKLHPSTILAASWYIIRFIWGLSKVYLI
jgi:hypothetical protein